MAYRGYSTVNGFIVDPNGFGDFTTISAAVAVVPANATIYVRPGTYGGFIVPRNMNIVAVAGQNFNVGLIPVIINGQVSVNASNIGVGFEGIGFVTNGATSVSNNATNGTQMIFNNCSFGVTNANAFAMGGGGANQIELNECTGGFTNGFTLFSITGGVFVITNCTLIGSPTTTYSVVNGTSVRIYNSSLYCPIQTTNGGAITAFNSRWGVTNSKNPIFINNQWFDLAGGTNELSYFSHCNISSGSAACMNVGVNSTAEVTHCDFLSSATNVLTGAGTLFYAYISFSGTGFGNTVTTSTALHQLT